MTRQRENFVTLMNNYSTAQNYAKIATESSGTALEKFQAYEESVEAKTQALTAAVEGLVNNFTSSDFMKAGLDIAKTFVNIADSFHLLEVAFAGLGIAGVISIFSKLSDYVDKINTQFTTLNKTTTLLGQITGEQTTTIKALEVALNKEGLSLSNLTKEQMVELLVQNKTKLKLEEVTRAKLADILATKGFPPEAAKEIAARVIETNAIEAEEVELGKLIALKAKEFGMKAVKLLTNPYVAAELFFLGVFSIK